MRFSEEQLKGELNDVTTIDLNFKTLVNNNDLIHIFHYPNATSISSSYSHCRIVGMYTCNTKHVAT